MKTPHEEEQEPLTDREWIDAFAAAPGTSATDDAEPEAILTLASTAARASQRAAAPVACRLATAVGRTPVDALALARTFAGAG